MILGGKQRGGKPHTGVEHINKMEAAEGNYLRERMPFQTDAIPIREAECRVIRV
jgi:hypothetical protein